MPVYTLVYSSVPESEDQMINDLDRIMTANRVDTDIRRCISLAVSEAFANAVTHGNLQNPAKLVKIDLQVNKSEIIADVRDEGRGGLERIKARKPAAPLAESGRGIDLMKHSVSSVDFRESDSGGLIVSIRLVRQTEQKMNG